MKKLSLIVVATLFFVVNMSAQEEATFQFVASKAKVMESSKIMSQGTNNALTIELLNTDEKTAEKVWKKFMRDYKGKPKYDRKLNEHFSDDAEIPNISNNTVDVYATFDETGSTTTATFWFDLGGAYLDSDTHAAPYSAAEELLRNYIQDVNLIHAEDALKEQEDMLKDLEKELEKLEKENKDFHEEIEEAKKLIAEMEKNIELNLEEQSAKKKEIETQENVVNSAKKNVKQYNR